MDIQTILAKFNSLLRVRRVEKNDESSQFVNMRAELEKHGVSIESEEALVGFLADESSDVAELLNQNRLHNDTAKIVEVLEPLNSQPALVRPAYREHE